MSKQKKYKIILGILIFVLGTIASIYFTVYLDALFSHKDINIYIFKIERIKNFFKNDIRTLKLFFLLGQHTNLKVIKELLAKNLRGEITIN